jgi:hypothetical protein
VTMAARASGRTARMAISLSFRNGAGPAVYAFLTSVYYASSETMCCGGAAEG